jgi:hypothetical protein
MARFLGRSCVILQARTVQPGGFAVGAQLLATALSIRAYVQELALIAELIALGQSHLFSAWPAPGTSDAQKKKLVTQLVALNRSYHGGLAAYVTNARKLLQDSKEGECRATHTEHPQMLPTEQC